MGGEEEYIEEKSGNTSSENQMVKGEKIMININKATKEQLQELSGIGDATAQKIIDYRKENGDFKQVEDLKNVPGIGDAKFERIKENICIK